jgi:hypothetical protein
MAGRGSGLRLGILRNCSRACGNFTRPLRSTDSGEQRIGGTESRDHPAQVRKARAVDSQRQWCEKRLDAWSRTAATDLARVAGNEETRIAVKGDHCLSHRAYHGNYNCP